jgi:hypothetical protein
MERRFAPPLSSLSLENGEEAVKAIPTGPTGPGAVVIYRCSSVTRAAVSTRTRLVPGFRGVSTPRIPSDFTLSIAMQKSLICMQSRVQSPGSDSFMAFSIVDAAAAQYPCAISTMAILHRVTCVGGAAIKISCIVFMMTLLT